MENYANIFAIDGIEDGYRAEHDVSAAEPKIVVRDYHGIAAFDLPGHASVEEINRAVSIFERGFRGGERHAEGAARSKVLKALNIDPTKPAPWVNGERALTFPQSAADSRAAREPLQSGIVDSVLEIALLTLIVFGLCGFFIPNVCDWFSTPQEPVEYAVLVGGAAGVALPYLFKRYVTH